MALPMRSQSSRNDQCHSLLSMQRLLADGQRYEGLAQPAGIGQTSAAVPGHAGSDARDRCALIVGEGKRSRNGTRVVAEPPVQNGESSFSRCYLTTAHPSNSDSVSVITGNTS